ncbi:MAG: hypothetical protein ACJAYN_002637, partial [Bermanella sp.]
MKKSNVCVRSYYGTNFDVNSLSQRLIKRKSGCLCRSAKQVNRFIFTLLFSLGSSLQLAAQSLVDSDLNNQSLYASGYITAGARTTVGGNVQSATAVTLAANAIFAGNVEAGAATTLGADAGVV